MYREDLSWMHDDLGIDYDKFFEGCGETIDCEYYHILNSYEDESEIDDNLRMMTMAKAIGASISASICTLANAIVTASCIRNNGIDEVGDAVMEVAGSLAKELPDAIKEAACMLDYSGIEQAISSHEVSIVSETQAERDERHAEEMRLEIERMKHREKYDAEL